MKEIDIIWQIVEASRWREYDMIFLKLFELAGHDITVFLILFLYCLEF